MGINRKAKNLQNLGFEWIFILIEVLKLYIILHITIGRFLSESKGPTLKFYPIPFTDVCPNLGEIFKCNIYHTIFSSIQSHARHIIDVHPEQTNYKCDYCPNNICSNLEVAHEGCDCSWNACEERMK